MASASLNPWGTSMGHSLLEFHTMLRSTPPRTSPDLWSSRATRRHRHTSCRWRPRSIRRWASRWWVVLQASPSRGSGNVVVLAEIAPNAAPPTPDELRHYVRSQLTLEVDADIINPFSSNRKRSEILRERIRNAIVQRQLVPTPSLVDSLFDEIVGLGPLQPLLNDPQITDILVNRFDEIYVERRGRLEFVPNAFRG